jgi:oligopeptide/dipeptide ABC transporter ATP-binding protein
MKARAVSRQPETSRSRARGVDSESPEPGRTVLAVKDLTVDLLVTGSYLPAVRGVSFELGRGRTLGIVGESGSGKSVTARAITGLLPRKRSVLSGSVAIEGRDVLHADEETRRRYRGSEIGIVFQDPTRALNPTMRVGEQIVEAIRTHQKVSRSEARRQALELLTMVGIPAARERYRSYPNELSGGMRQRVTIAIAISCRPSILIADEPTTALDVTTQLQIMELIQRLQDELEMSVVLITHDISLAAKFVDEIAVMYAGKIVERGPVATVLSNVQMPYTHGLLGSMPRPQVTPHSRLHALSGQPPDPRDLPQGCPFAVRCAWARDRCRDSEPSLPANASQHAWACWFPLGQAED